MGSFLAQKKAFLINGQNLGKNRPKMPKIERYQKSLK
jgi:hypothetical protein